MAFGMFTAISGLAEILCQTFLDVIPNLIDQGETCSHVSSFYLIFVISRALLWNGNFRRCDCSLHLLSPGAPHVPPAEHH